MPALKLIPRIKYWTKNQNSGKPATILEASEDLSVYAFKAWIRLMLVLNPDEVLGIRKIQVAIGYSRKRTFEILHELRRKGYIEWKAEKKGVAIQLVVLRRAMLVGRDNFIKLSSFVGGTFPEDLGDPEVLAIRCCPIYSKTVSQILLAIVKEEYLPGKHWAESLRAIFKNFDSRRKKLCVRSKCFGICTAKATFQVVKQMLEKEIFFGSHPGNTFLSPLRDFSMRHMPRETTFVSKPKIGESIEKSCTGNTRNINWAMGDRENPYKPGNTVSKPNFKSPESLHFIFPTKVSLTPINLNSSLEKRRSKFQGRETNPERVCRTTPSFPEAEALPAGVSDRDQKPASQTPPGIARGELSPEANSNGGAEVIESQTKASGDLRDRFASAWSAEKSQRKVRRKEAKDVHEVRAVKRVSKILGREVSPATARELLRNDGEIVYRTLMETCSLENSAFAPGDEEYEEIKAVFDMRKNARQRVQMFRDFGKALMHIYMTYRNQFEVRAPSFPFEYVFEEGAMNCVMLGVTPIQLISYWADLSKKVFNMDFPPLKFLCRHSTIDEVKSHLPLLWEPGGPEKKAKRQKEIQKRRVQERREYVATPVTRDVMNAFGKGDELDPRVRSGLMEAGIDVSRYDDKFLATFQATGKMYSQRPYIFLSGASAPIVKWIARNIYGAKV